MPERRQPGRGGPKTLDLGPGVWLECSTLAEAEAVDAVAEVFARHGQGVAIEEPIVSSADGETVEIATGKPVLVKTYLPQDDRTEQRQRHLEEGIWHLGRLRQVGPLQVKRLKESDWADAWKKHFFVHHVGQRLVIVPSWRRHRARDGEVVIRLDPGMAFGTGLHPTTRLCLRALEEHVRGGEAILDLGTGSGILAMAAAKLGARRVLALDVEPLAARVATENVARNDLASLVEVRQGTLPEGGTVILSGVSHPPRANHRGMKVTSHTVILSEAKDRVTDVPRLPIFRRAKNQVRTANADLIPRSAQEDRGEREMYDLIVANISFRVLSDLRVALRQALRPGGLALLSGVLEEDAPRLAELLLGDGWRLIDQQCEAEWALLVATAEPP